MEITVNRAVPRLAEKYNLDEQEIFDLFNESLQDAAFEFQE